MNTRQINRILAPEVTFKGAFPADLLSTISCEKFPYCCISNTDESHLPGKHWVAFYFEDEKTCYFFDSYGRPPLNPFFEKFLSGYTKILYNPIHIQQLFSNVCGQYCVYFIHHKCRNLTYNAILKHFKPENRAFNDKLVNNFVHKKFDMTFNIFDKKQLRNQFAVALRYLVE